MNYAVLCLCFFPVALIHAVLEAEFDIFITACQKDRSEDLCSFLRPGVEQVPELSLRDHRDLLELLLIYIEKFNDCCVYIVKPFDRSFALFIQYSLFFLRDSPRSPQFLSLIAGPPPHMVFLPLVSEIKVHETLDIILRVFTSEILCISVSSAGSAVQGEADRVKDRGLARAGVSGDQKKPPLLKLLKIDFRHCLRVGTECADH